MAASGGRNQRRLADLRTEREPSRAEPSDDVLALQEGIAQSLKMTQSMMWNDEKDRLSLLVSTATSMEMDSAVIKELQKNFFDFLSIPQDHFENSKKAKIFYTPSPALTRGSSSSSRSISSSSSISLSSSSTSIRPFTDAPDFLTALIQNNIPSDLVSPVDDDDTNNIL